MDLLQAMILGLVEGITEFLPVSSTGHLIVVSQWLGVAQNGDNKAFEVIIQLGAILAVVADYRERFTPTPEHIELWKRVMLAFIPVGVFGLLLHTQIKAMFNLNIVAVMFIVGGIIFLLVEFLHRGREYMTHRVEDISYRQALWIGIAQVFALIPGTSRAGATIIGALLVEVDRKTSAEFSFLLALPVMLAASGFDLVRHWHDFAGIDFAPLLVGFVVAFASAWLVMRLFISFLQRFTFVPFGIYRIAFGALLLWLAG
jgi:undecaprenyl-diphosphatase